MLVHEVADLIVHEYERGRIVSDVIKLFWDFNCNTQHLKSTSTIYCFIQFMFAFGLCVV